MEAPNERIIEAAVELFVQNGCKRITMDQIASSIHISKRTLYENFSCKEELLDACLGTIFQKVEYGVKVIREATSDPLLVIFYMGQNHTHFCFKYERLIDDTRDYYPAIYKKYLSMTAQEVVNRITKLLEDARDRNLLRPDANLKVAANAMVYFLEQVRNSKMLNENSRYDISSEFLFTYIRGLMSEEAIADYCKNDSVVRLRLSSIFPWLA